MPSWNLFVKGQEGKTMNFVQDLDPTVSISKFSSLYFECSTGGYSNCSKNVD